MAAVAPVRGAGTGRVAGVRAEAREVAWAQRASPVPVARAAGVGLPGLLIDIDASIVVCHSEKGQAATTFKHTFGYRQGSGRTGRTGPHLDVLAPLDLRLGSLASSLRILVAISCSHLITYCTQSVTWSS